MTNGLFMIAATVVACGGLAVSYRTLTAYIMLRLKLMQAKIKNRLASCGRAVRKNRYRLLRRTIRLEPTVAWPESGPHPPEFLDGGLEEPPISKTKAGIHFHEMIHTSLDHDFRDIKEHDDRLKQLEKNERGMITICEKLALQTLDLENRLKITEDKLRDAIFILYEGRKVTDD